MKKNKFRNLISLALLTIGMFQATPTMAAPHTGTVTSWEEIEKGVKTNNIKEQTGWIKDGYDWKYVYSNGDICNGWLKDGDYWYYFDKNKSNHMVKDTRMKIDNKVYSFDSNGHINATDTNELAGNPQKTGWILDEFWDRLGQLDLNESNWRYVYADGQNCIGWLQDGGYWYYFDKCGHMVKNNMRKIDGKVYYFDSNGHVEANMSKEIFYTESVLNHTGSTDGSGLLCATTKLNVQSDANGVCTLTDNYYDDVNIVLCHKEGHKTSDGNVHWVLFDKNGDEVIGWYLEPISIYTNGNTITERWTYYDENGVQVSGTSKAIDGKTYSFDSKGYLM